MFRSGIIRRKTRINKRKCSRISVTWGVFFTKGVRRFENRGILEGSGSEYSGTVCTHGFGNESEGSN